MADIGSIFANGIAAILELIVRGLAFLLRYGSALIAYLCSKAYRDRKNLEWGPDRKRKWLALGFSGFCLAVLLGISVWAAVGIQHQKQKSLKARREFQFKIEAKDKEGKVFKVGIKEGGLSNIAGAKDLKELANRIKENMTVVRNGTNDSATNYSVEFQFGTAEN